MQTPNGRKAVTDASKKWISKNPDKRFRYVVQYRDRVGYYIPTELHELFAAIKKLDATLESAENGSAVRSTSQRRCQQSVERRNRFGRRANVLEPCKSGGTERVE